MGIFVIYTKYNYDFKYQLSAKHVGDCSNHDYAYKIYVHTNNKALNGASYTM